MAKRRVVAMVDPDPEWVSLVDKGAARKTFRVLKRADGAAELVPDDCDDCGLEILKAGNINNLAKEYAKEAHPFTACMNDPMLVKQYPDEATRKQICGKVKALVGKEDEPLRKSMIAALKERLGVLKGLFDTVDGETSAVGDSESETEQGAAIIGAVFDRQVFPDAEAVKNWLTEKELPCVGDVFEADMSYRVCCVEEVNEDLDVETQPFDTGVVLLTQKADVQPYVEQPPELPITTTRDLNDGHVHGIGDLNDKQDGWTTGGGNPMHMHRIIGGIVQDWKSSYTGTELVTGGGYNSAHPGSVRSITTYAEKSATPATERAEGGSVMKEQKGAAPEATPGAETVTKGMGGGPASHVNFRSGITDVSTSPGIFQAFDLMQRVLFNSLNDANIADKSKHIADNLTEFNNFVLEQIGKFEPTAVAEEMVEEHKRYITALKEDGNAEAIEPDAVIGMMAELVVLLREALGKPTDEPTDETAETTVEKGADAPLNMVHKVAEMMEGVAAKFEGVSNRLDAVEKGVIGRRGVSEVTETPESKMRQKRSKDDGVYDNLFPWGHRPPGNDEY